ncbi:MAG: hypothetical protein HOP12_08585 [Candidatus Eisenbacteria bacterium]|uniref:DUF4397 domain-containing protein n=1 Tax=Eiseniibacteriota bacterium TaxID=2212470 RepID=A0A849SYP8_UNCEI|nr:hypothetical protein [Candidatus Eisenbacteria bacterium]
MKLCATVALLLTLATSAGAAVIHDESIHGDLSSNAAVPSPLALAVGGNTVIGTVANSNAAPPAGDRDFVRFTVASGQMLIGLNLLGYSPSNLSFAAFNAGTTSFVPGPATIDSFLSGIHIAGTDLGTNLMPRFVSNSVTTFALATPLLGPGDYCFMIQQTSNLVQSYSLEFVIEAPVPTETRTWGAIKALYR